MMQAFKFIDLFAGIGGFRLALDSLGGKCVFTSEIDRQAAETYSNNHSGEIHGDIREITHPQKSDHFIDIMIENHDVLAAGFPCQPFSLAGVSARNSLGRSHGLLDEAQGTLFYDIARIVDVKRPKALLLENVSNIVNHDNGKTFKIIRAIVEEQLGYQFFYQVLSSETLVPQRRKRCFIVALRDHVTSFDFPVLEGKPLPLRIALESNVDDSFTISDKSWAGHKRRTETNLGRGAGFTAYEADLDRPSHTLVARYYKDGKECLIPQPDKNPRFLTPRECARLQGFPESFKPHPSRSAAYKQFGNAVPVPLVTAVAKKMLEALSTGERLDRQIDATAAVAKYGSDQRQKYKTGNDSPALLAS
jgi:DNA (cytosine-5)-methyltransferase 1